MAAAKCGGAAVLRLETCCCDTSSVLRYFYEVAASIAHMIQDDLSADAPPAGISYCRFPHAFYLMVALRYLQKVLSGLMIDNECHGKEASTVAGIH